MFATNPGRRIDRAGRNSVGGIRPDNSRKIQSKRILGATVQAKQITSLDRQIPFGPFHKPKKIPERWPESPANRSSSLLGR